MPTRAETRTIDTLLSIAAEFMVPTLYDTIFEATPGLSWLNGSLGKEIRRISGVTTSQGVDKTLKRIYPGGESITETVIVDKGTPAIPIKGLETVPQLEEDPTNLARWFPKFYVKTLVLAQDNILKANATRASTIRFLETQMRVVESQMRETLNAELHGDGVTAPSISGKSFEGWAAVMNPAFTYGSLAPATFPTWVPSVDEASGSFATNGRSKMRQMVNTLTIQNDRPTIIFMDDIMLDRFDKHIESKEFFNSGGNLKVGFVNRDFMGIPVIMDKTMPADTIYYMNDKFVNLDVHKDADMKLLPPQRLTDRVGISRQLIFMGELIVNDRRRFGKLSGWTA